MKDKALFGLALLSCLLLSISSPEPPAKSLVRVEDPVVMKGSELSLLRGSPVDKLALMINMGGQWTPAPFQLDQVKPDGEYAFTSGPEAGLDPDPNLDDDDELVFMAKDTGDRFTGSGLPTGVVSGMEIEVIDPIDGGRGFAYLLRYRGGPPRSGKDYVKLRIDEANNYRWCETPDLIVGAPLDRVYPDHISQMIPETGAPGKDVLDRLKIRGEFVFPGVTIPFNADELIKTRDRGYIDGPVRVLQYIYGFMEVSGYEFRGMGYSTLVYYTNHLIVPVTIEAGPRIPDWLISYIPKGQVRGYMDFNENIAGSKVFSAANPLNPEVVLDGKMSAAEKNLDREANIDWIGGYGPEGGIVVRLVLIGVASEHSNMTTYYLDDRSGSDPPEDHPGVSSVGFDIRGKGGDMSELARSASFEVHAYARRDLTPDNVHEILDIRDRPLQVRTRALEMPAR